MAAIRYCTLVQCLRLLALVTLFAITGCTSSGKLPNPSEEEDLATFRVSRVTGKAAVQPTAADTNKSLVTVTFTTKVASAATGELEPAGMKFDIYEGSTHIGMRKLEWEGEIQWQKTFTIEKGVDYPYQLLQFRIVGQSPHRGTRTVCLEVNPSVGGESVSFDCTNGATRAPIAAGGGQPKLAADGTVTNDSLPEFYVRSMKVVSTESDLESISPVTRQPRRKIYGLRACLNVLKQDRPKLRPGQQFYVEGFGALDLSEVRAVGATKKSDGTIVQPVKADDEGCFEFMSAFDDFKFVTHKRSFRRQVTIRPDNPVVNRAPKHHVIYVDPWEANENVVFAGGQDLEKIGRQPNPKLVTIDICNGDDACEKAKAALPSASRGLHPPRIQLNGYITNFMGRRFSIDENLNIGSQRVYDFAFKPFLERWAGDSYKPFDLNGGKFKVKLLLLKTHGETPDQFPLTPEGIKTRLEEELCFHKEDSFDLVADKELRGRCYARAFLDYKETTVEVKGGEFNFSAALDFSDMRYIFSKNLLMIEVSPAEDLGTGIEPTTFIGLFLPLEDNSRRLRDAMTRAVDYAPTADPRDQIRIDYESVFARWEKDALDEGVKGFLNKLSRELPSREGMLLADELDLKRNTEERSDSHHFLPDNRQKREIVLRTLRAKLQPEPIDRIMEIIKRDLGEITTLKDLRIGKGEHRGVAKVEIYRRMNRLKASGNKLEASDRETILKSISPRIDSIGRPSEIEGVLAENPETNAALGRACDAVYPVEDQRAAEAEAKKFRDEEWEAALAAYTKQRQILCKIQDVVAKKVYDNVELDVSKITGGCEDTRALCTRPLIAAKDSPNLSGFAKAVRWVFPSTGDGSADGVCGRMIPERENALLMAIQTNDQSLLQRALGMKGDVENSAVEWLARQYLTQMPFSLVRAEVVRRLDNSAAAPQFRLGEILLDPRKVDAQNPLHRKYAERFQPRLKKDRCKASPLDYLSLDVSEHVLRVNGRAKTVRAGSTNLSVFANISHGEHQNDSNYSGSSRQNVIGASAKASVGTTANLQGGLSFSGGVVSGSATLSGRADLGAEKSISSSQTWYISETRSNVRSRGTTMGEAASRTLNAEEVTFEFKADVLTCLSIQGLDRNTQATLRGGLLFCREKPDTRDVTETWYYTYLFFRNSNSAFHDATENLIMRPWTVLIRGRDQFEWFKTILQNHALTVKLSPDRVPGPDEPMSDAFDAYQNYRKRRDLPGLLTLKHLVPAPSSSAVVK